MTDIPVDISETTVDRWAKDSHTPPELSAVLRGLLSEVATTHGELRKAMEQVQSLCQELESARVALTAAEKPAWLRGKRSIVGAAIMLPDGLVICGVRHFDKHMIEVLKRLGYADKPLPVGVVQGFIANDYEFEDRQSAWLIALRAGQFDPKNATGTQGTLYSEDLW